MYIPILEHMYKEGCWGRVTSASDPEIPKKDDEDIHCSLLSIPDISPSPAPFILQPHPSSAEKEKPEKF
jgi:hypothetical protein